MAKADSLLSIGADLTELRKALAQIPNLTAAEAQRTLIQIERVVTKAEAAAKKAAKEAAAANKQAADSAASSWQGMSQKVAGYLAQFAGVGGIILLTQKLLEVVSAVGKLHSELERAGTRAGLTADTMQVLKVAAEGSGLEFEAVTKAANRFPAIIGKVAEGNEAASKKFSDLGVQVRTASGAMRDGDAIFAETMDAILALPDPTQRAATAVDLFGRSGSVMLQAFQGTGGFERMNELTREFGVDLGPDAINAVAGWSRAMANLKLVMRGFADEFSDALGQGTVTDALKNFTLGVVYAGTALEEILGAAARRGGENLRALGDLVDAVTGEIRAALSGDWAAAGKMDEAAGDALRRLWYGTLGVGEMADQVGTAFDRAQKRALAFFQVTRNMTSGAGGAPEGEGWGEEGAPKPGKPAAEEDLGKGWEQSWREYEAAIAAVAAIQEKANADLLSDEERILEARDDEIAKIREKLALTGDVAAAQEAAAAVEQRAIRDIVALREKEAEAERQRQQATADAQIQTTASVYGSIASLAQSAGEANEENAVEAFRIQQIASAAQVAVLGIQEIARGYAEGGVYGAAAAVLAVGAQEAAVWAQQPPSFYSGGPLDAPSTGGLFVGHPGEFVSNRTAVETLGRETLEAANRGEAPSRPVIVQWTTDRGVWGASMAREIRHGGRLAGEVNRNTGRLGHRS